MAGDWMKIDLELPDKPEIHEMAGILNISPNEVVGCLIRVWAWFNKQTTNGNARGVTFSLLDRITSVTGFGEAMMFVGWIEQNDKVLCMPKFDRHTSESAKTRALTSKRVDKLRNASTVTKALPEKRREEVKYSSAKQKITLTNDGRFENLNEHLEVWNNAYPNVDVEKQIAKAGAWCKSNPTKAPKSNYPRFLNAWLSRSNDNNKSNNDDVFAGAI
jgi:hypothetical protein